MTGRDAEVSAGRTRAKQWTAVVGDNTIDRYVGSSTAEYAGGNAYNVAVQLARAGERVEYFSAVGPDDNGAIILAGLSHNGLQTAGVVTLEGSTALTLIRLTERGDRVFEKEDFGVTAEYFPDDETLARIAEADWVHIGMLPRASELRARLRAMNQKLVISQDCAVSDGSDNLDVGFFSAGENADAKSQATQAVEQGVGLAIVTRGADGALAFDGSRWWSQEAIPAVVVDTTGAGDSFIAGFIASRLRTENSAEPRDGGQYDDIAASLRNGAMSASITCQHVASWPHPGEPLVRPGSPAL